MTFLANFLFLTLLITSSFAISLKSSASLSTTVSAQLKTTLQSFKPETKFGNEFLSTLMIKIQSNDKVSNLISFINELENDLNNDQNLDNNASDTKNLFWNTTITELNTEIDILQKEIESLSLEIEELTLQVKQLNRQLLILNAQLSLLDQKQSQLEEARKSDIVAYNARISQQNSMVSALNVIVANLTTIVENNSFLEKREAMRLIEELGKNHILTSLLTLSSSFTPASVNAILQKLKEIKSSLSASIEEDEAYELVAEANYITLINEFETSRLYVQQGISDIEEEIEGVESKIEANEKQIESDKEIVVVNQEKVVEYETEQANFNALYEKRLSARSNDLSTITNALDIVEQSSSSIRTSLQ